MITLRQIQRLWNARRYERLIQELIYARVESSPRVLGRLTDPAAAAALALIRLDELGQAHDPIAQTLLRSIIASQGADGGWNDPMLCSLCVRALLTARGQGLAVERGLMFLAAMQKSEGVWPAEPIRRMPADSFASAFVLLQLCNAEEFRRTVRFDDAIEWFGSNQNSIDGDTAKLWQHVALRTAATPRRVAAAVELWS